MHRTLPHVPDARVVVCHSTVPIRGLPAELGGLRIAHISDFHFRRWNRVHEAAQDMLLALEYDLLVVTGDFCVSSHRWTRPAELTRRLLAPIAERVPIYAVLGNHDHPDLADAPHMPVTFLRNQSVPIRRAGAVLELAGVEQTRRGQYDLAAALGNGRVCGPTVLLAHYPSTVFHLPAGRVSLQLSGHTHGGQIRFRRVGCLWTNDRISRRMARGLHVVGGVPLHISPGIGVSRPIPLRINCPPQIDVLTLEPVQETGLRRLSACNAQAGPVS